MLSDPPPEKNRRPSRPHPLEAQPAEPSSDAQPPRQRIQLHIPVVRPLLTYSLIALNLAIFFVAFFILNVNDRDLLYDWGANNGRFVLHFGEFYRLTTSMFLHGNIAHVVFNMLSLYYIGSAIERFFGHFRFGLIYFFGGLAGSISSAILNNLNSYSVGASGAVFAILGAQIVFIYRHRKLLGQGGQAQLRQLVIIAAMNLALGFASGLNTGGVVIDNWAHIGGLAGGAVLTWFIGPLYIFGHHPQHPGEYIAEDINPLHRRYQALLMFVSVMLAALIVASMISR
ncbi:MAG: rhomboid family intramembrane serine protease [bacterium]|nr:rhomboid family intramembrane serine protease [bacterium]